MGNSFKKYKYALVSFTTPNSNEDPNMRGIKIRSAHTSLEEADRYLKTLNQHEVEPGIKIYIKNMKEFVTWEKDPIKKLSLDRKTKAVFNELIKLIHVKDLVYMILEYNKEIDYLTEDVHNNKQNYYCAQFSKEDYSVNILDVFPTRSEAEMYCIQQQQSTLLMYDIFVGEIGKWTLWPYCVESFNVDEKKLNEQVKKYKITDKRLIY